MELNLQTLKIKVEDCIRCSLYKNRIQTVFGQIVKNSDLLFIGEAPGYLEDVKGEPFVGRSGQELDKALTQHGFNRNEVSILNCVKCKPPDNRDPTPDELFWCNDYLIRQIMYINPKIIITLGRIATWTLFIKKDLDFEKPAITSMPSMGLLFKQDINFQIAGKPYKTVVMYHPSYWMRSRKVCKPHIEAQFTRIKELLDVCHK